MEHEALTGAVIGGAMRVHRTLGPGYLESVYQRALAWELRLARLPVDVERRLVVRYRGCDVGVFVPDLIVDERVVIELKAVERLHPIHEAQLVSYLKSTGYDLGLLINFGAGSLEVRRKVRELPSTGLQD
ncbi:GxxExxY protein [Roseisolibacter sp. H3M3-2]|uniref:GxxExxY protein n=1 Tax=Roseisolibacter sp. H3M3-2 TaxID=3031323 RepID=UPI0023DCE2E8|nr:GxxExxY protein [Roseisolibacter sp. H3M3-2]MDF1504633.1 GxxExxY protein [Roseisolibacter sp. H3M3-2]